MITEEKLKEVLHKHGLECMELGEKTVINSLIMTMNCLKTMSPEATLTPDAVIQIVQNMPDLSDETKMSKHMEALSND